MSCHLYVSARLAEYRLTNQALLEGGLVQYWLVRESFGDWVLKAKLRCLMRLCLTVSDHLLSCTGLLFAARHAIPLILIECYTY